MHSKVIFFFFFLAVCTDLCSKYYAFSRAHPSVLFLFFYYCNLYNNCYHLVGFIHTYIRHRCTILPVVCTLMVRNQCKKEIYVFCFCFWKYVYFGYAKKNIIILCQILMFKKCKTILRIRYFTKFNVKFIYYYAKSIMDYAIMATLSLN